MKVSADHCFTIGRPHLINGTPCEDYALSGADTSRACIVVADGCSSAGYSDVAARVIAHTLKSELVREPLRHPRGLLRALQERANVAEGSLAIFGMPLRATALGAHVAGDHAIVYVYGDGVVARKYRDGSLVVERYEWNGEAPFYPSYRTDAERAAFVKFHQGVALPLTVRHDKIGSPDASRETGYSVCEGMQGIRSTIEGEEFTRNGGLEFLALMSDGVMRVKGVEWQDLVSSLLSFKGTAGSFVKRRFMHVVREAHKAGHELLDDLACAVIHISPEEVSDGENQIS